MIYIIRGFKEKKSWVTAVINGRDKAIDFLSKIEAEENTEYHIDRTFGADLPFVIMEEYSDTMNNLRFLSPNIADRKMRKIYRSDGKYKFYAITETFESDPPGKSMMDVLTRTDADTEERKELLKVGVKVLNI